jgi:hypothetical protein
MNMMMNTSKRGFEQLKLVFQVTSILRIPDLNKPFLVYCDASREPVRAHYSNWTKMGMTIPFILLTDN